ncbi:MAG: nucleotidyltransferase family protein [Isosphaeraceae bacterium]
MSGVTALILAGGQGTRLRGVLPRIPKVLAPVGGRPFLSYLLDQLQVAGVRDVVLCTGYRADQVFEAFGTRHEDLELHYSCESRPLGTAGAIRLAISRVEAERYLVLNGDSYIHWPLDDFHRWHVARESSYPGSLLLTWTEDTSRFGSVELGSREAIRSFREKTRFPEAGLINTGVYLFRSSLLESIRAGREVSLEKEMFPRWIDQGLGGYTTRAPFVDIGTPESFARAGSFMAGVQAIGRSPELSSISD